MQRGTEGSKGKLKKANRFDREQSMDFGRVFDQAFGEAFAARLGGVPIRNARARPSCCPRRIASRWERPGSSGASGRRTLTPHADRTDRALSPTARRSAIPTAPEKTAEHG